METDYERQVDPKKVQKLIDKAVWRAVLRHKKLGESIAVWRDGRVVTLSADEIVVPEDVDDL